MNEPEAKTLVEKLYGMKSPTLISIPEELLGNEHREARRAWVRGNTPDNHVFVRVIQYGQWTWAAYEPER